MAEEDSSISTSDENTVEESSKTEAHIVSQLMDETLTEEELEDLFNKNTESFRCLAQILISRSSLLRHPLYHFPPLEDPGLDAAINYVEPPPLVDNIGCEYYLEQCKEAGIVPISRVVKSLPTHTLDLTYYGLTEKNVRAIMNTLKRNEYVSSLILQDNWITPQAVEYISSMLEANNVISYLNLRECRIKPEGAANLNMGLLSTIKLHELDLSYNSLGDEGIILLERGLMENMSISKLNLSHNNIGEEAASILADIVVGNTFIEVLDMSWNNLNSGPGNKIFFAALADSKVKHLNLSWNGIGTREAALPVSKYLKATERLEYFDISNNRLTKGPLSLIRMGIAKCPALRTVKIGNNLITPDEAFPVLKLCVTKPLLDELDMENVFVKKDFVPMWKRLVASGKHIQIGGVLSNYTIRGPDTVKLLFDRARYLAMKAKKKKAQKDFGHFILQMGESPLPKQQFQDLFKKFKMKKVDSDLLQAIIDKFLRKSDIDVVAMRNSYMYYYPDTCLPPPKKAKGKKGKKGKKGASPPEPPPPPEGQLQAEGQPQAEGQLPTEGQPPAEGQPPVEGQLPAEGEAPPEGQPPTEGDAATEGQPLAEEQAAVESQPSEVEQQPAEGQPPEGEALAAEVPSESPGGEQKETNEIPESSPEQPAPVPEEA